MQCTIPGSFHSNLFFRDFDPCFGSEVLEEADSDLNISVDIEDEEQDVAEAGLGVLPNESNNKSTPPVEDHERQTAPVEKKKSSPLRFPIGSPKKINFGPKKAAESGGGPPKPPRSYDYAPLLEESSKSSGGGRKTPLDLLSSKMRKGSSSGGGGGKSDELDEFKSCDSENKTAEERAEENLYVTLPVSPRDTHSPASLTPPFRESPPPPLPATLPPSAKPKQTTMYENVWIESQPPPAIPPPVLDPATACEDGGGGEPPAVPPRNGNF